jgi:glutamate-5-semialdehyde dehydrogenase
MTEDANDRSQAGVALVAQRARVAARALAKLSSECRTEILMAAAQAIEDAGSEILEANGHDCRAAEPSVAAGSMTSATFARLRVAMPGIAQMAAHVRGVAGLPDPLGRRLAATELDDGLVLYKESCPLGVIGIVFESRPDVVPQVAALALKSGNAIILKGGAEAFHSNEALVTAWRKSLSRFPSVPQDSISLLQTRSDVKELLEQDRFVDLIIPRGSQAFVRLISQNSKIPVLGHGEGICHVYVDQAADVEKAIAITHDSKVQYPAACNSVETLLVHEAIASKFLPRAFSTLKNAGVELRVCPRSLALLGEDGLLEATEKDWGTEYSDLILSVKIVSNLEEAMAHIHRYGSGHTETIVTENAETAKQFLDEIDAAGVYHNASTRFADGFRYGFGSELGISTNKLHARGPMGLEGLTTYKYKLYGNGQTVAAYARGEKQFKHRRLD